MSKYCPYLNKMSVIIEIKFMYSDVKTACISAVKQLDSLIILLFL